MSHLRSVLASKIKETWIEVVLDVDECLRDLLRNDRDRFRDNLGLGSWLGSNLRRLLSIHSP